MVSTAVRELRRRNIQNSLPCALRDHVNEAKQILAGIAESHAAACTRRLLDLPEPPTCIMYPDDMSAFGGIEYLRSTGRRVPEDISVTGYDGTEFSQMLLPPLTTYWQNAEKMGLEAAKELVSAIEHPKSTYLKRITIEGELWRGDTVMKL